MPKQFNDFGFKPTPWTSFDVVMVWVGSMANRFADSNSEVSNLSLLNGLKALKGDNTGKQLFDQVRWTVDPLSPTTVPAADASGFVSLAPAKRKSSESSLATVFDSKRLNRHFAQLAPLSQTAGAEDRAHQMEKWGGVGPDYVPKASNLWIAGPEKTVDGSSVLINGPQFGWF